MEEETKDKIEYIAGVGVEAVLSAVPVIGAPLATVFGRTVESAQSRRNQRLLDEVRQDIDRLVEESMVVDLDDVLASDQFLANLTIAFRAMQATADEEKLAQLRRALVEGLLPKWRSRSEWFMNATVRLSPIHVQVLAVIVDLSGDRPKGILDGAAKVRDELSRIGIHRNESHITHVCGELAVEGFLMDTPLDSGRKVRLTHDGVRFHKFLARER